MVPVARPSTVNDLPNSCKLINPRAGHGAKALKLHNIAWTAQVTATMQSLLRSSKIFRFTVPSHLESRCLLNPVQQALVNVCHRLSTAETGSTGKGSPVGPEITAEQKLISRWQDQQDLREASEADIRGLLHAAVALRRAKAPGVTDQLLQLVMKCAAAKGCFLKVVCEDFGVQGEYRQRLLAFCLCVHLKQAEAAKDVLLQAKRWLRQFIHI